MSRCGVLYERAAQQGNAAAAAAMAEWEGGRAVDTRSAAAGDTPLMVAAASGRIDCCRVLLAAGADALAAGWLLQTHPHTAPTHRTLLCTVVVYQRASMPLKLRVPATSQRLVPTPE